MRTQITEGLDIEGYYYNAARCLCLQGNRYDQEKLLKQSHTLYVGNLSFYSTEDQVGQSTSRLFGQTCGRMQHNTFQSSSCIGLNVLTQISPNMHLSLDCI